MVKGMKGAGLRVADVRRPGALRCGERRCVAAGLPRVSRRLPSPRLAPRSRAFGRRAAPAAALGVAEVRRHAGVAQRVAPVGRASASSSAPRRAAAPSPACTVRGKARMGVAVPRRRMRTTCRTGCCARRARSRSRSIDTGADLNAPDIAAKKPAVVEPRTGTTDVRDTVGHGTFVAALAAGSVTNEEGIAGFGGDANADDQGRSRPTARHRRRRSSAIVYAVDQARGSSTSASADRGRPRPSGARSTTRRPRRARRRRGRQPARGRQYRVYPAALVQPLGSKGVGGTGLAVGASTERRARRLLEHRHVPLARAPGRTSSRRRILESPAARFPRVACRAPSRPLRLRERNVVRGAPRWPVRPRS